MPNDTYIEERIKPGVRRLTVPQPNDEQEQSERKMMQAWLAQLEPGPTRTLLALILKRMGLGKEE